jgi:hypothetical protein
VRGNTRVELRGDRRTAKKRRKALKDAASGSEQVFEFFDQQSTDENVPTPDLEVAASDGPAEAPRAAPTGDATDERQDAGAGADEPGDQAVDETPPTPAVAKLERLRREAEDKPAKAVEAKAASPIAAIDRRRHVEPPSHRAQAPKPTPDPARGIAPLPNRQSTRPPVAPPPERVPPAERTHGDAVAPRGPVDRRRPAPPPTHRATAPMIGEVRNVAGRRADDAAKDADASTDSGPDAAGGADQAVAGATLNAVEVFDADRAAEAAPAPAAPSVASTEAAPEHGEPDSTRVDVDEKGDWIPPVLRGIAPDAAEAKANLPHRPRR